MSLSDDTSTDVPGTVYLVDTSRNLTDAAHAGHDILLIPQPSKSPADPLNWPKHKKYWTLFLISAYACVNSFGENVWGAPWTTISQETGVQMTDMNGGSALNYLMLGFFNIIWIPTAMKLGRKIVYIMSLTCVLAGGVWGGFFKGTVQYYFMLALTGVGTSAYQALVQLTIFDMFFAHERGRMIAVYIFFQQLGSILGLILGGYISDDIGWRWSQPIVAIACAILILLFIFTFDDTAFPRHKHLPNPTDDPKPTPDEHIKPPRTYLQKLSLIHRHEPQTTWFQYFRRPFYLFTFPNIVLAGIQFAFGCTAGIVSFNTISEIMTEPPYNWSSGAAGLLFLAALVGDFIGISLASLTDPLVLHLTRKNNGYKEPEMRLWAYIPPLLLALTGYLLYGWSATLGENWVAVAVGLACMIAQQVCGTSVATAYAMECFDGISGELVIVLAICSSVINFAVSFSVQHFIEATSYGWTFTFFGIWVVVSMLMGGPMLVWGKSWRRRCKARYERFLAETGR